MPQALYASQEAGMLYEPMLRKMHVAIAQLGTDVEDTLSPLTIH